MSRKYRIRLRRQDGSEALAAYDEETFLQFWKDGQLPARAEYFDEASEAWKPITELVDRLKANTPEAQTPEELQPALGRGVLSPLIILACVGVFVVMLLSGVSLMQPTVGQLQVFGGNHYVLTMGGEQWRLFTSLFVHVGIVHLLVNMLALSVVGPSAERLFGSGVYLLIYLGSGLIASLCSIGFNPIGLTSAGASGAIFGLIGSQVGFLLMRHRELPFDVLKQSLKAQLGFIAFNIFLGFSIPSIDNAAHIGGLIAGIALGAAGSRTLVPMEPSLLLKNTLIRAGFCVAMLGALVFLAVQVAPNPLILF